MYRIILTQICLVVEIRDNTMPIMDRTILAQVCLDEEIRENFVLFVLVLSLVLVLSIFPIYSRFIHPLGNSDLLQTSVYCAFHLSTLSHTVNALSLTPLQHTGTHFKKTSDFLSQFLPLD